MKHVLPILLFLIVFISCKKKDSEPGPDYARQIEGTYLAEIVSLEGWDSHLPNDSIKVEISLSRDKKNVVNYDIMTSYKGHKNPAYGKADTKPDGPIYLHPTASSHFFGNVDGDKIYIEFIRYDLRRIQIWGVRK